MLNALEELRKIRAGENSSLAIPKQNDGLLQSNSSTGVGLMHSQKSPTKPTKGVAFADGTSLVDRNSDLTRLHEMIIKLRCSDPPKGAWKEAVAFIARKSDQLAARSIEAGGTEDGWYDPDDEFADWDQLTGLRVALAELEAGPYPIPLPEGCTLLPQANFDPFQYGRLYNGMVSTAA